MSDDEYTPTTENVRNTYAYIGQGFAPSTRKNRALAEAEFDRWLAEHDRQIAENAWDEGYSAGASDVFEQRWDDRLTPNPFREDS